MQIVPKSQKNNTEHFVLVIIVNTAEIAYLFQMLVLSIREFNAEIYRFVPLLAVVCISFTKVY